MEALQKNICYLQNHINISTLWNRKDMSLANVLPLWHFTAYTFYSLCGLLKSQPASVIIKHSDFLLPLSEETSQWDLNIWSKHRKNNERKNEDLTSCSTENCVLNLNWKEKAILLPWLWIPQSVCVPASRLNAFNEGVHLSPLFL